MELHPGVNLSVTTGLRRLKISLNFAKRVPLRPRSQLARSVLTLVARSSVTSADRFGIVDSDRAERRIPAQQWRPVLEISSSETPGVATRVPSASGTRQLVGLGAGDEFTVHTRDVVPGLAHLTDVVGNEEQADDKLTWLERGDLGADVLTICE